MGRRAGAIRRVAVHALVKTFGPTAALRGVDAQFEPGLTLLVGANGSGKTTLLRILATVLQPTSGEVVYEPLGADPSAARAELGWVSHELLGYPDLSARETVELAARLHGIDPRAAWQRAEERYGLTALAHRPLRTYSRGQRQRVALSRALLHEPSLLLLDEPTTGLDRAGVEVLRSALREQLEREAIVICVTHDPALFDELADWTITLKGGRVRS